MVANEQTGHRWGRDRANILPQGITGGPVWQRLQSENSEDSDDDLIDIGSPSLGPQRSVPNLTIESAARPEPERWTEPLSQAGRWSPKKLWEKLSGVDENNVKREWGKPMFGRAARWLCGVVPERYRRVLMCVYLVLCAGTLGSLYYLNGYVGYGGSTSMGTPTVLGCDTTYWGSECGINGANCRPFTTNEWEPIRCPGGCGWKSNHVIGTEVYRADSKICQAAIHSNLIGSVRGGCVMVRFTGNQKHFNGSTSNGITSQSRSYGFVKSFELSSCPNASLCASYQWVILATTLAMFALLLLFQPSNEILFSLLMALGFWYCVLIGQPDYSYTSIRDAFANIVPFAGVGYVMFARGGRALPPPTHVFDRLILYVIPVWMTIHMNYVALFVDFDLTPGGMSYGSGPYYKAAIAGILIGSSLLMLGTCMVAWKHRRLLRMIGRYLVVTGIVGIISVLAHTHFSLHLHHYLIALALWPLTVFPHRLCSIIQGLLLGMFINGVAVWGMGALWELKGAPPVEPVGLDLEILNITNSTIQIAWGNCTEILAGEGVYSLFANDVEVYRDSSCGYTLGGLSPDTLYYLVLRRVLGGRLSNLGMAASVTTHGSY